MAITPLLWLRRGEDCYHCGFLAVTADIFWTAVRKLLIYPSAGRPPCACRKICIPTLSSAAGRPLHSSVTTDQSSHPPAAAQRDDNDPLRIVAAHSWWLLVRWLSWEGGWGGSSRWSDSYRHGGRATDRRTSIGEIGVALRGRLRLPLISYFPIVIGWAFFRDFNVEPFILHVLHSIFNIAIAVGCIFATVMYIISKFDPIHSGLCY